MISSVYGFCLVLGLGYALVSAFLSFLGHGAGDIHVDAGGHLDAGHLGPTTGPVIATFITCFGAGGLVAEKNLGLSAVASAGVAVASGSLLAAVAFGLFYMLFSHTQAGSHYTTDELAGRDAEVITSIPPGGTGEIAYVIRGQRERAGAQGQGSEPIPKGSVVVIESMVGSIASVRSKEVSKE